MKNILLAVLLLFSPLIFSQHGDPKAPGYISMENYRGAKKIGIKFDSIGFKLKGKDTLIKIVNENTHEFLKNQVRVAYENKDSTFLEVYKNVVYNTERVSREDNRNLMHLWKDTLKVFFNKAVPLSHKQSVMKLAKKVSKDIDSLNIIEVSNLQQSNYLIYYMDEEEPFDYELAINNKKAGYYVTWDEKQFITTCRLKVNTMEPEIDDLNNLVQLKFFFFRSLGYFFDSPQITCKGYLSACPEIRKLTPMDLEILKYHYSYGICKGTDLKTFEKQHAKMKAILKDDPEAKVYFTHRIN